MRKIFEINQLKIIGLNQCENSLQMDDAFGPGLLY